MISIVILIVESDEFELSSLVDLRHMRARQDFLHYLRGLVLRTLGDGPT